jgi:hypothetical protein
VLRELGGHIFQCIIGANLNTLGFSFPSCLTEVTDQRIVSLRRIKTGDLGWTSFLALSTRGTEAPFTVHNHMKLLLVIMDDRRIYRASLLAFPLLF